LYVTTATSVEIVTPPPSPRATSNRGTAVRRFTTATVAASENGARSHRTSPGASTVNRALPSPERTTAAGSAAGSCGSSCGCAAAPPMIAATKKKGAIRIFLNI
jgi:hypothetical protein